MKFDYTKKEIVQSLKELGIAEGDNLFIHSNIGFFGKLKDAKNSTDYYNAFKEAIFQVIGEKGTLVMPTFSYSFCKGEVYDKNITDGDCGALSELMRKDSESLRSEDANFSIVAIGENAKYFIENPDEYSFGKNSFWSRFLEKRGIICNFNFDSASTFIHYVERELQVPYRYDKKFEGTAIIDEKKVCKNFYHFVYDLEKQYDSPDFKKFDNKARERLLVKSTNLGKGQIVLIKSKDIFELIEMEIKEDKSFLIKGEN